MSSDAIQFLLRLSDRLKVGLRLEAAMVAISDATLELLGGDHASVRLLDSTGERLLCGARSGVGLQNQPFVFRLGEGAIGWAVANCQVVHIRDTAADQRFTPAEDQGFSIRSLLALPLWSEGRVVGVLGCSSKAVGAFSKEQETLGCLLANCVSPYIEKARMERLMITDPHTMAFNERYFFPRLKEEFERVRRNETRLSLLLMDLDLGQVRSQRGHGIHDRLLQCFVDRVRTSVRLSDTFFRRGEAFALIMPDLALGPASIVADRIHHSMTEYPLELGDLRLPVSLSAGIACWNGQETGEELEVRAAAALEEARQRGRCRTIRARYFTGCPEDRRSCLRESCEGSLEEIQPESGPVYYRCSREGCRSIWYFEE